MSAEPEQSRVKSGSAVSIRVTFENRASTPARLALEWTNPSTLGSIGDESDEELTDVMLGASADPAKTKANQKGKPKAKSKAKAPKLRGTPGFEIRTFDSKDRNTDYPNVALLGLLAARPSDAIRIELAPGARVVAHAVFSANGYDPDKSYFPKGQRAGEAFSLPPKPALKPGRYRLEIEVPAYLADKGAAHVSTQIDITR